MRRLMLAVRARGDLFFVDSVTSPASVADQIAGEHGVPSLRRHVFLDSERDPGAISAQLQSLVRLAHRNGAAVAIGHAYSETLTELERWIPTLSAQRIELVPPSVMLGWRDGKARLWQSSASR